MKILIFGSNGQLGKKMVQVLSHVGEVISCPRELVDINDYKSVDEYIIKNSPKILVNCAAFTDVENAELNKNKAFEVNANAVGNLAKIAKKRDICLVHFSTDYVFSGKNAQPYQEDDATDPINIYGKSKLAGETLISESGCKHLIFRTTWVVGEGGQNFATKILQLAKDRKNLSVINDQFGVPTTTTLIAKVTSDAICAIKRSEPWPHGIYNLVPKGVTNWYELAKLIISHASEKNVKLNMHYEDVSPISSKDYATSTQRPENSLLNTTKLTNYLSFQLPEWQSDLYDELDNIIRAQD